MPSLDMHHALVVGIAQYQHADVLHPVAAVRNDAQDVGDRLQRRGYPRDNMQVLLDEAATRTALLGALDALAANCGSDAYATIYLSCHGGYDGSARAYLLPWDADWTTHDAIARTAIAEGEFTKKVGAIQGTVTLFLDCCHAGGIVDLQDFPLRRGLPHATYHALVAGAPRRAVLAASRPDEESHVDPGDRNSLFTKHLIAALDGGIAGGDGTIRVTQLWQYLHEKVTGDRDDQHPVFKVYLEEDYTFAGPPGAQAPAQ